MKSDRKMTRNDLLVQNPKAVVPKLVSHDVSAREALYTSPLRDGQGNVSSAILRIMLLLEKEGCFFSHQKSLPTLEGVACTRFCI